MKVVDQTLNKLAELIQQGRFVELETEGLEIKPVPADGGEWKECQKSVNAFLNTRGGIVILGVKEEGAGPARRYVLSEWKEHAEPNLKELPRLFTDRKGVKLDLSDRFPPMEIRTLLGKRVAVLYVDELAADRKFVFFHGTAYKRILTGDHKVTDRAIEAQEEFKEEAAHAKELQPVPDMAETDLDLTKLNQFIFHLNQPKQVETLKPDLASARAFLERRSFLRDGAVSVLGALVCGNYPGDRLGFRSHVHGYVDVPQQIAQDKQDYVDNVLQLMDASLGYLLRNIQVGISPEAGGTAKPQYPEELLRETVNNALAHRDYSVNKQVIIAIKPGVHIAIRNPGRFRQALLIEDGEAASRSAVSSRKPSRATPSWRRCCESIENGKGAVMACPRWSTYAWRTKSISPTTVSTPRKFASICAPASCSTIEWSACSRRSTATSPTSRTASRCPRSKNWCSPT